MASSIGRIALGVVGAVIGAPFGLSAIGFSIGSAIGGSLFAPDGPNVEGPRLGDTSVAASSLGKVIPEHWGVTRTAGNVIWSAGLKEIKKVEEVGGGGKGGGGGGGTQTTYEYLASFATSLGKGPAKQVRKIWADGKLIYDGTGDSDTDNSKYVWRLRTGAADEGVDPLISESIHRRLAGMPDVNEGNQEQAVYATLSDLISETAAAGDARSTMYSNALAALKASAEAAVEEGAVPNYQFTPAYRGLALIVFDDMKLADFGNRIPNITAEVVWEGAASGNGTSDDDEAVPVGVDVTEIAATAVPDGLMATDTVNKKAFAHADGTLRRFSSEGRNEDRQAELPEDGAEPSAWLGSSYDLVGAGEGEHYEYTYFPLANQYGYTVNSLLAALPSGDVFGVGTRKKEGTVDAADVTEPSAFFLSGTGLEPIGSTNAATYTSIVSAAAVKITGAYPAWLQVNEADRGDPGTVATDGETGDHFAGAYGSTVVAGRATSGTITDTATTTSATTAAGIAVPNVGPVTTGAGGEGKANFFVSKYAGGAFWIGRYLLANSAIVGGTAVYGALSLSIPGSVEMANPFSTNIDYISALIFNPGTDALILVLALTGGDTGVIYLDEEFNKVWEVEIPGVTPPLADSGMSRSDVTNNTLAFADGTDIIEITTVDGSYTIHEDVMAAAASNKAQAYFAEIAGLLLFEAGTPRIYGVGAVAGSTRDHDIAATLPEVISSICVRAGMEPDEYDVSGVSDHPVRGYTLARATSGRQALDYLMQAFFVDGVETDWALKFSDRDTTSLRTIPENELGEVGGPTGNVNWLETRTPEYDLPSEVNVNFADPIRDYQTNTAHKRRISNPVPSMYSHKVENIELPMVMKEWEAKDTAERLLFLSWMSRDLAKSKLSWAHADLDPGDVISVAFNDGRTVTDRIAKATLGANFEMEVESVRSGDPVYESAPTTIIPTGSIPTVNSGKPVSSEMFVFDTPLLYDYHETGRAVARYYTAVGSESTKWSSATIFKSTDGNSYSAQDTVSLECTWGSVIGQLNAPRALWTTDTENKLRVAIAKDRGDIAAVTREEILNGANRALVYNRETGVGEIIQFQDVAVKNNGTTFVLSNLTRGIRGTEYAVDKHGSGEIFILLKETDFQVGATELSALGTSAYFKAVSAGQIITGVSARSRQFKGRSLMPYAPSRVRRSDDGSDLTITWNRRTRISGGWDMTTPMETVPLSEDFEQYELYLLPTGLAALEIFDPSNTGSYLEKVTVNTTEHTFTASDLSGHGLTLDDKINVAVYQISAQVGRGFPSLGGLAP